MDSYYPKLPRVTVFNQQTLVVTYTNGTKTRVPYYDRQAAIDFLYSEGDHILDYHIEDYTSEENS